MMKAVEPIYRPILENQHLQHDTMRGYIDQLEREGELLPPEIIWAATHVIRHLIVKFIHYGHSPRMYVAGTQISWLWTDNSTLTKLRLEEWHISLGRTEFESGPAWVHGFEIDNELISYRYPKESLTFVEHTDLLSNYNEIRREFYEWLTIGYKPVEQKPVRRSLLFGG